MLVVAALPWAAPAAHGLDFVGTVPDQRYVVGSAVDVTLPKTRVAGDCTGAQVAYTLTPAPPAGLSFAAGTRVLSGTPTTRTATARYAYRGRDTGCQETATQEFDVTVTAAGHVTLSRATGSLAGSLGRRHRDAAGGQFADRGRR